MDLDGISVFVAVVQAGSFSQAARNLEMPTTTVSAKVARLERRLGVTLIQRTTRKINITPSGQTYFAGCSRALEEIQTAESELETKTPEPNGLLRITSPVDIAHGLLPEIVRAYLKRYPRTQIELIVTNRLVDLISEGVDLAVRAGELEDSSLIARKFGSVNGGLWASASYLKKMGTPKTPKDLESHDFLIFSEIMKDRLPITDGTQEVEVPVRGRLSSDDFGTLRALALGGEGITPLPQFLAVDPTVTGKLIRVLPKWTWEEGSYSLVYPAQRFVSPKTRAFIALAMGEPSD